MNSSNIGSKNWINVTLKRAFVTLVLALACFGFAQTSRAVSPAPDGGYPGSNTAEGDFALLNLTSGVYNTAIGTEALLFNTTGTQNTGVGAFALFSNSTGSQNTGLGAFALEN